MPIIGIIASAIQKAFSAFSDNFNRLTSGSLGTSSSGGLWETLRGTWFTNGSSAQSDDAANTYPISLIKSSSDSTTISIVPGSGGQVVSTTGLIGSVASGNGTTGVTGFHWATITGMSSTTGISVGDYISATGGTGSIYGGTPDFVEVTSIPSSTSITYRIKGGTVPVAGTVTNITTKGKDGGAGAALWITDSGNWFGVSYGRSIDTSCNCSQCGNGTYSCTGWGRTADCNGWTQNCASYSCNRWRNYSAASSWGWASGGGFRITGYAWASDCSGWQGNSCSSSCTGGWFLSGYACSTTTENTSACACQTCYPPYISVIRSASNVVTESIRWTLSSMAAAFKVVSDSTTKIITVRPYKDKAMTTQIGLDLTRDVSATAIPTAKFGIVLTPSDQIQGKNLDDFNLSQN
jgi:hypothetical protein